MNAQARAGTLERDTLNGRSIIAAEHARLVADQALQTVELILAIGSFAELDAGSDPRIRPAVTRLEAARDAIRQARKILREPPLAVASAEPRQETGVQL